MRHTLLFVLEALLRALHPVIPFITEEIWHEVAPKLGIAGGSVSAQNYPAASAYAGFIDGVAAEAIEWLRAVLTSVRRIRSEMNIAPGKTIPLLFAGGTAHQRELANLFGAQIAFLARTSSQRCLEAGETEPASAAAIVGDMRVLIPLAGLIDVAAEKTRLTKETKRIEGEIVKCKGKLGNANFVNNAPAEVVEQEQQRLGEFETTLNALSDQLRRLSDF
jgi:valyl-tRNA synthetase